jgi:phosphatidylglycerol lysyltransferase
MKRRWLLWLLIIAFVWLVISRFTEIQKLADILSQGQWQWILAAAVLQALYFVMYAALYQAAFHTVEVESRVGELIPVLLSSWFVNVVAPSGGASAAALFMDDAARRGQSPTRAAAGALLVLVADFGSFLLLLAIGLVYLFMQHSLQFYHIVGTVVLFLFIGGLSGILLLGVWQPLRLRGLLNWFQQHVNRLAAKLQRPPWLPDDWADKNATEFTEASLAVVTYPQRLAHTVGVALAAHLASLASLYALFLAFQQPIQFGALVAGFSVGELFLIVSPIPMGIGVVEGLMVLAYNSLGVPTETAAVVTLAFRGLSLWLPLFIGFFLLRRVKSFGAEEYSRAEVSSVRAVALLTALMGLVNLISAITPSWPTRLLLIEQFSPLGITHGGHLAIALTGFALLVLARGLWQRKRLAWVLTLLILDASIVSHLLKGLDYEEAIMAGVLAAWLFILYPHFHARPDRPAYRQGLQVLTIAVLYTLAYGTVGYYSLGQQFQADFGLGTAFVQAVLRFVPLRHQGLGAGTGFSEYFASSIYMVGAVTTGCALFMALRPALVRPPATKPEVRKARAVVEAYGYPSLSRLALLDDKSYYFSVAGSVVAYVVEGRVALALAGPVGPISDIATAIRGFQVHCAENGWCPAFHQVRSDYLEHYRAAGFVATCVGQEAIVDLQMFSPAEDISNTLWLPVNRLNNLGYRVQVFAPPLQDALLRELSFVSDEWLVTIRGGEKRFSLGWFEEDYIRNCPVAVVYTRENLVGAFTNIISGCHHNEVGVDLVRHRHDVPNGLMEFVFVNMIRWAKGEGYKTFNLGLTALADTAENLDDAETTWSLHYINEHIARFYRHTGSRSFKQKFRPRWSSLYLVYPAGISLASVTMSLIRADTGADFVWGYFKGLPHPASGRSG